MPGTNGTTGSPRVPVSVAPYRDRRASSSSDTSLPDTNLRQLSSESVEHIPTRTATVSASKPAANPLQFIKVGPANLYKAAQEQIKKVEEVKKLKEEVRNEEEDWQSNLDNWKSSRRKRQEHIIERVVEVKKLELEEHDRNRRRSKTFNEMMEDRNRAGRKLGLQVFKDEDANDLSDLGIGTSSGKSSISEDYNHDDNLSVDGREHLGKYNYETPNGDERKNGLNGHHDDDTSTTATISSPEPEEYTYERAIQSYVNFTETRVKSRTMNNINNNVNGNQGNEKLTNNVSAENLSNGTSATKKIPPPVAPRKESAAKKEERLSAREQRRSSIDSDTTKKLGLQKVDVLKRRELFEKASKSEASKSNRAYGDFSKTKSIKERLSNLEKHNEDANGNKRRHSTDVSSSVKDRLSQFKKSSENISLKESPKLIHRLSTGDSASSQSIQERLSSLEKNLNNDRELSPNKLISEDFSHSIKDRLSNLDSAMNRENGSKLTPDKDPSFQTKLANFRNTETNPFEEGMNTRLFFPNTLNPDRLMNPEEEIYQTKRQQFHRSLDNLDAEISSETQRNDTSFERVQSLEDLECCSNTRNYPPSSSSTEMLALSTQSGDTDREDSGIHTADVSCSVSQADEPVEDSEIVPVTSNLAPLLESVVNSIDALQNGTQSIHKNRNILENTLEDQDINKDTSKFNSVVDCDASNLPATSKDIDVPSYHKVEDITNFESAMSLGGKLEQQEDMFISSGRMENTDGNKSNYVFVEDNLSKEICDRLEKEVPSQVQDENKSKLLAVEGGNFISEDIKDYQLFSEQDKVTDNHSNTLIFEKQKDDSVSFLNTSNQCNIEEDVIYSIANQIPTLNLLSDIEFVADLAFPLGPPTSAEPPKEKPPPPPTDLSDEDVPPPVTSLKRLDSTKRIKKEIRKKRSDFLGIEGGNDDGYLEPELKLAPPPDMVMFLVEERRSEQQMYRQSICSESDSALGETTESRDSGVELDRGHPDDMWTTSQPAFSPSSSQHSRQNSELYGNASITSEEDEISKREREIIEILEKEEKWRYGDNTTSEQNDIGEKLAAKLRQLEQEKQRLEWEKVEEEKLLQARQHELQHQEEQLRAERDRLQRENEALERQKEELRLYEQQQQQQQKQQTQQQHWGSTSALPALNQRWDSTRLSLQDISHQTGHTIPAPAPVQHLTQSPVNNYRLSLPNLQQDGGIQTTRVSPSRRAPPPIPPAKPLRVVSQEQRESIRSSRVPSADHLLSNGSVPSQIGAQTNSQQMSRQTLQALSAAPRSRLISTDNWMQAKRKPEGQRNNNYQHWLVQEAEHRRITEQQQRAPRRPPPPAQQQVWNSQLAPRQDKPLPDSIIQTLTQRVQNRVGLVDNKNIPRRRLEDSPSREAPVQSLPPANNIPQPVAQVDNQEKMLSVSGKKKCSHCGEELGRGAAMIIESLRLFYHIDCFKCCVCHVQLGDGLMGTDVRVRNNKLHCHNCYSSDDGVKFSCV